MVKVTGADTLRDGHVAEYSGANDPVIRTKVQGDEFERLRIEADGSIFRGDGTAAPAADSADAASIAFDSTGLDNTDATTIQDAIADLDAAISALA